MRIYCLKKKKILKLVTETSYIFSLHGRKSCITKTGELYYVSKWTATVLPTNNPLSWRCKSTKWNEKKKKAWLDWVHSGDICCIAFADGLHAKMHFSLRHWCHSSLHSPSHTSVCAGKAACAVRLISSSFTWKFLKWQVVIWRSYCVYTKGWRKGSFGLSRLNLKKALLWFLVSSSGFVKHFKSFCGPSLRFRWSQLRLTPVRFVRGPLDAVFLPGQSVKGTLRPSVCGGGWGGVKWAAAWSLGERSKGSPCRKLRRAGLYPPPGTDGTASLVCPSASRFGAERGGKSKRMWSVSCPNARY